MTETEVQPVARAEGASAQEPSAPNIVELASGTVTLHPKVTIEIGIAALSVIKQGGSQAEIEVGLAKVYLRYGIADWSFGVPITPENIERFLPYGEGGLEVAERADALYSEDVMRPLLARMAKLSPRMRPVRPTSATSRTGSRPLTPSGRSSRNGTAGKL